jgi:hypothetical protein
MGDGVLQVALLAVMRDPLQVVGELLADRPLLPFTERAQDAVASGPPEAGDLTLKPVAREMLELRPPGPQEVPRKGDLLGEILGAQRVLPRGWLSPGWLDSCCGTCLSCGKASRSNAPARPSGQAFWAAALGRGLNYHP